MVQVRDMCLADAGWVAGLSAQLGYPVEAAGLALRFERLQNQPDNGVFAALLDASGVGWLHVYGLRLLETEGYAEIGGLVVDETVRRRGIGSALVRQAEQWAEGAGYRELRLRSGLHREGAHSFYRSLGYAQAKASYMFRKEL